MTTRRDYEVLLCPIIERHLHSARQSGLSDWPLSFHDDKPRSAKYALHIAMAESMGPSAFGLTEADVTLTDVRRSLAESQRLLQSLSGEHRLQLSCMVSTSAKLINQRGVLSSLEDALMCAQMDAGARRWRGEAPSRVTPHEVATQLWTRESLTAREGELVSEILTGHGGLEAFEALLGALLTELPPMEREHRGLRKASRKPNWRAAAVAGKCREVWADEHREIASPAWQKHCKTKGRGLNECAQKLCFAPEVQNHDAPGPFGRFLGDILGALGICTEVGDAVTAAVSLNHWRKMRKQNAQE